MSPICRSELGPQKVGSPQGALRGEENAARSLVRAAFGDDASLSAARGIMLAFAPGVQRRPTMAPRVTLREVIAAVSEFAHSDAEVIATVTHLVNTGRVRLRGEFAGARIDVSRRTGPETHASA
jgi:hypothetical protein